MCGPCDKTWKQTARRTPALIQRCPNCSHEYFRSRAIPERPSGNTGNSKNEPLTGPLADAMSRAMSAEGLAADVRARILSRLANDDDPYISSLLRSLSGVPA